VLQFDDVMNKQREVIYEQRRKVLLGENLRENIIEMLRRLVGEYMDTYCNEKVHADEWDLPALCERVQELANRHVAIAPEELEGLDRDTVRRRLEDAIIAAYEAREREIGPELMREVERHFLLRFIDMKWVEHLRAMDDLREGIGLRAYGQKNPLLEYQFEAYEMFQNMLRSVQEDTVHALFRVRVQVEAPPQREQREDLLSRAAYHGAGGQAVQRTAPRRVEAKVGRNDPCPCGSGKKYKKCCGANAS